MSIPTDDTHLLRMRYADEDDALRMLRERNVLKKTMKCPGKGGLECQRTMVERRRENRSNIWRCSRRSCRKVLSLRAGCAFFYFKSDNLIHKSNIPITQALEILTQARTRGESNVLGWMQKAGIVQTFLREQSISPESLRRGSLPQTPLSGNTQWYAFWCVSK